MAASADPTDDLSLLMRAEPLPAGLRSRQLRPNRGLYEGYVHLVVLSSGRLQLEAGEAMHEIEAPAGLILPPARQNLLMLEAGAEGWIFGLPPQFLGEVMGSRPELELMLPLGRQLILARRPGEEGPMDGEALSRAILQEYSAGIVGSRIAVFAWLRLLILAIWRASQQEAVLSGFGSEAHLLEGFRREVEQHFRSHMSIAAYAGRLGLSTSRLRRICLRNLGRTPLQLVHMRMLREAGAWLEHTRRGISEVALMLGFADSTEFSHFFRRNTGLSPSRYREARQAGAAVPDDERLSFADWP